MKKEEKRKALPTSGGGLLESKKNLGELKKFSKNKKANRMIIGSIVGIILLIGGITLYRTFALYEEKREFNVIQGRIPDFSTLSVKYVIGEMETSTVPSKTDGYVQTGINCTGVKNYNWDNANWKVSYSVSDLTNKDVNCTVTFNRYLANVIAVGDYVSYTPASTSYKIATTLTNYTLEQNINPSELNLWRVIRKNEDGTIEIVSEYASSNTIYFKGVIGYNKFISSLNTIAKQYETSGITSGSRHMGYNGQTETTTAKSSSTSPWSSSTSSTNSANGSTREKAGGGDYGWEEDYNLVNEAMGTTIVYKPKTTTAIDYWLASRYFQYMTSSAHRFSARVVNTNGSVTSNPLYSYNGGATQVTKNAAIRPIVTLKFGITASEGKMNSKKLWTVN